MRAIIFGLIFFSFFSFVASVPAQVAKINLRSGGLGKISVSKGKLRSTIDLSRDVGGCAYVYGDYKRTLDARECASPPASFKLIDASAKQNETFLVVMAEAMGNCNVCGQCGASEAFTLIWLKLDARLRVLEKKSVPLELCIENISLISPAIQINEDVDNETLTLAFSGDVLKLEIEKTVYGDDVDKPSYEFSRVEYNRKTPEKGFVIKTETRAKSANP